MAIFLSLGVFFFPLQEARASLLSSILGTNVSASNDSGTISGILGNSQTSLALVPQVSLNSFDNHPNSKDGNDIDENSDVNILSDNALLPATGPLGVSDGNNGGDYSFDQISVYVVRKGDTISVVANMFGVSTDTILAANDMKKGEKLVEGDTLFILPISGIEHKVAKGQTLKGIANLYKVDISDIALYNGIAEDSALTVGDKLIIPGAAMSDEGGDKPAANLGTVKVKDQNYYASHPIKDLAGFFINPLPTGHKTQGLHGPGHRGIDIGAPTGTPLYASASGTVIVTKTGCVVGKKSCGGGYGNMAIIQHQNGTKTLYGHMSKMITSTGASVTQGQLIGYVGSTGRSTGPHLHFEVFNAKNPGADGSWKK